MLIEKTRWKCIDFDNKIKAFCAVRYAALPCEAHLMRDVESALTAKDESAYYEIFIKGEKVGNGIIEKWTDIESRMSECVTNWRQQNQED